MGQLRIIAMLTVTLTRVTPIKDGYRIHLTDTNFIYFTSKREALAFLADLSRRLNSCLRQLNEAYCCIAQIIQREFFSFTPQQALRFTTLRENFQERISFILVKYWAKENSFYITTCRLLGNYLEEMLALAAEFHKARYTGVEAATGLYADMIRIALHQIEEITTTTPSINSNNQVA